METPQQLPAPHRTEREWMRIRYVFRKFSNIFLFELLSNFHSLAINELHMRIITDRGTALLTNAAPNGKRMDEN